MDTLNWIGSAVGLPLLDVECKVKNARRQLTNKLTRTARRFYAPTVCAIAALEQASANLGSEALGYVADIFRFAAGGSARFDDVQHVEETELKDNGASVIALGWQTKTLQLTDARTMTLPICAPKRSFTGHRWWETFVVRYARLRGLPGFMDRDYLLPSLSRGRKAFLPVPMPRSQAQRLLSEFFIQGGVPQEVAAKLTLHCLRLFAPNLAFETGLPIDDRQPLGRWLDERSANIYQRSIQTRVESCWGKLLFTYMNDEFTETRVKEVSTNIHGKEFFPPEVENSEEAIVEDVAAGALGAAPAQELSEEDPEKLDALAVFTEATEHPSAPIRLGCNMRGKIPKAHYFGADLRAVGCSWKVKTEARVRWITASEAWDTFKSHSGQFCERCSGKICTTKWMGSLGCLSGVGPF